MPYARGKIIVSAVLCCLVAPVVAGSRRNFLAHGPSVADLGRGDTGVAVCSDIASVVTNPALIAADSHTTVSMARHPLIDGASYHYFGCGVPIRRAAVLAISAVNLTSGPVELRRTIDAHPSTAQASQWAGVLSLAAPRVLPLQCDAGLSLKYVYHDLVGTRGSGMGVDAGIARRLTGPVLFSIPSDVSVGCAVQNAVSPTLRLASVEESYQPVYRIGAALSLPVYYRLAGADILLAALDYRVEDANGYPAAGLEYASAKGLYLRAGTYDAHITAGLGLRWQAISVQYAADFSDFATIHRFGFTLTAVGTGKSAPRAAGKLRREADDAARQAAQEEARHKQAVKPLFAAAVQDYQQGNYLSAREKLGRIILYSDSYEGANAYYRKIGGELKKTAENTYEPDMQKLSYARGFMAFEQGEYQRAVSEWKKYLSFSSHNVEVSSWMARAEQLARDQARSTAELRAEQEAQEFFARGKEAFDQGKLVTCIKAMEAGRECCRVTPFPGSVALYTQADEYIQRAITALSQSLKSPGSSSRNVRRPAKPENERDEAGAEKKYREGLVMYAHGRAAEAVRTWELALRLNPAHEKAVKAIRSVQQENHAVTP
jgi:tetratricopeptide (TPR) repeat protein